ncbi:MAG: hypothetical protein A3E80_00365 [Chlamydiae bacterium RIFCSPHIGHO2_12_FULL_49_9]|nr:MAG: hypothetical protein A3E80_00365 [Chlamydiae bacterium RIFCSPHIGHO2_12_FULL_49_9]
MTLPKNLAEITPLSYYFQIKAPSVLNGFSDPASLSFLNTMQQIVDGMIPDALWQEIRSSEDLPSPGSLYYKLNRLLPFIVHSKLDDGATSVSITYLCPGEYTHGVGRYVVDSLSRWLIPGKQLSMAGNLGLNFQFTHPESPEYYVCREIVSIETKEDLLVIRKNLPRLIEEMRINMMSVYHARYITSLKSLSPELKNLIIQENLSSLLNHPISGTNHSLYDQMQGFITKLSAEEKISEVKKNISYLLHTRPKAFDRDVYYEMTHFTILFTDAFSAKRESRHISRVIAYQYLFKKILQEKIRKAPFERHLSIKVLKSAFNEKEPIAAILIGMNFLKETERFEIRHLLEAIRSCLPNAAYVEESLINDRRHDKIRFFYLEIKLPNQTPFTQTEIKQLRQKLPTELIRQIENVVHPTFMPRNEEELIRNLILLSKQIKYVRDLPQVSIHYEKQSDVSLTFTVIAVRLLRAGKEPLSQLLRRVSSSLKVDIDDIRIVGHLKQKYPKEAAIFRASLEKSSFFRPNYSVDLLRARQKIVSELTQALGEFRDFNGGMIVKQDEAFTLLRKEVGALSQTFEFLLESYFYSLRPAVMQTIHDPSLLAKHFELLTEVLDIGLKGKTHQLISKSHGRFYICFILASNSSFKEEAVGQIGRLKISSHNLTSSSIQVEEGFLLGFVFRSETVEAATFEEALQTALSEWSSRANN